MTRHPDLLNGIVLLAVTLALFAPVVIQPAGLIYPPRGEFTDLTITHWPNIAFAVESLRDTGRLPLWRPLIMSGTPFAANPLSGLFYLPHVVFLMLPLAVGFNCLFIAHVWLTGCSAYALLRAWQVERPAAFIGALTWMATPKLFAHLGAGHVGMIESVAWIPISVLMAHRLIESRHVRDGVWLGAVWAMQFLADPRISFYTIVLSGTYILMAVLTETPNRKDNKALYFGVLSVIVVFVALSAMLWLPMAEFIAQSNRGAMTLADAGEWSLPWRQLVGLLLANWGGFHEWTVYVGILPLILAIVGFTSRAQKAGGKRLASGRSLPLAACFLLLAAIVAILFSLGTNGPLFPILFRILPGLSLLRVPPRAWFIFAFAVAMLCAFGVEAMNRYVSKPRSWVTLASVAVSAFALMFGLGGFFSLKGDTQAASARASLLHLAFALPVSVAVVMLRAHGRIGARGFVSGAAVVIGLMLLPFDWGLYRVVPEARAFSERADVAEWLAKQPGPFRTYSPSYSLPQHIAQRAGLELADGVDPMQIAAYARYMQQATGAQAARYSVTIPAFPPDADVRTALRDAPVDARLLGQLNVRYIVSEFPISADGVIEQARIGSTYIYENELVEPRVLVRGGTIPHITLAFPDRIVAEAEGPGMLTVSQPNYPGWHATVDGRVTFVEPVDSVLMGVRLDAGRHRVEFTFDPWTVKAGVFISTVGWSLVIASVFVVLLRGRLWKRAGK